MKYLILIVTFTLTLACASSDAQEIFKDKSSSIASIKASGYDVKNVGEDVFAYVRFDKYGKHRVYYYFTGDVVRRVVFLPDEPPSAIKMHRDILASMSWDEQGKSMEESKKNGDETGVLYVWKTIYYVGKAKYTFNIGNTYNSATFTIDLL